MTRTKPLSLLLAFAAIALVAVVAPGCGGGDNQATASSGGSNAASGSSTVGLSEIDGLGSTLVDMATDRDKLMVLATGRRNRIQSNGRPRFDLTDEEIERSPRTDNRLAYASRSQAEARMAKPTNRH